MSNVLIDRDKIDILANAISAKSGEELPLTLAEMVEAVDSIEQTIPSGNIDIARSGVTDVTNYATATVPSADVGPYFSGNFFTQSNVRKWRANYGADLIDAGWLDANVLNSSDFNAVPSNTSVTPSSSAQTIGGANYMMEGAVTVDAVPSGSVIQFFLEGEYDTRYGNRYWIPTATIEMSGYFEYGYYDTNAPTFNAVPANTVITPTTSAQTIGGAEYIMEGAVTVAAMPTGTAGTPTATKGTVSNHSVSVTPSVTNTTGYITGSTKTGTAVTVSASELVSGSETKTSNGTYDVTNLAELIVNVSGGTSWQTLYDGSVQVYSSSPNYFQISPYTTAFQSDQTYRVTWGQTQYLCNTITDPLGATYDGWLIGNLGIVGTGTDTGEPFIIYRNSATELTGGTTSSAGTASLKIELQQGGANLQNKIVTPTTSQQTVQADSGYDGLGTVTVNAMPSGTAGTPTATKGTVSNHSISVTPSVTNTTGYITGSTKTGTAVTVSASELVSGSDTVTSNDTYDVTNLAELVVNVSGGGSVTVTDEANATGTTCVITTGSAPSEDIPLNTQLIDFTAVKNGYIVDGNTGDEVVSQWSSCSDFTLIDPSMTFSYIGYQWYSVVFYDSGKSYISGFNMYQDTDVTITNDYAHGTLTPSKIPSTAKYVRIDSYPTNPNSTQLSLIRTA